MKNGIDRRRFVATTAASALSVVGFTPRALCAEEKAERAADAGLADREYWLSVVKRLGRPVLEALAKGELRTSLPLIGIDSQNRKAFAPLEALGRLLTGLSPWLELQGLSGEEENLRARFADLARIGIAKACDPESPDYMSFKQGSQSLVDAAFLAHAMLRAPRELWEKLDAVPQARLLKNLESSRAIKPGNNNWLLFSAMVEAALFKFSGKFERQPVETALTMHEKWYVGDGAYGDGPQFHWDYYNSFVIQPMLIDVIETLGGQEPRWQQMRGAVLKRAQRYAAVQEMLISPDGSYPPIGRSIAYRCGAFQHLSQMALRRELPQGLKPAQVRGALTAVIRKTLEAHGTFDKSGWLTIGLCGAQPALGERYISGGSVYLCAAALLALGLPPDDEFWKGHERWTQQRIWGGDNLTADHALK